MDSLCTRFFIEHVHQSKITNFFCQIWLLHHEGMFNSQRGLDMWLQSIYCCQYNITDGIFVWRPQDWMFFVNLQTMREIFQKRNLSVWKIATTKVFDVQETKQKKLRTNSLSHFSLYSFNPAKSPNDQKM